MLVIAGDSWQHRGSVAVGWLLVSCVNAECVVLARILIAVGQLAAHEQVLQRGHGVLWSKFMLLKALFHLSKIMVVALLSKAK